MADPDHIPDHIKYWESPDYTISKTIEKEGDISSQLPRLCSKVDIELELLSVTGVPQDEFQSSQTVTKYFHIPAEATFKLDLADTEIDRQVERCIKTCFPGERSRFNIRVLIEPRYSSPADQRQQCEPEWVTVEFCLRLVSLNNTPPIYLWTNQDKLDQAKEFYGHGVRLFKLKRYLDAFHHFKLAYKLSALARGIESDEFEGKPAANELHILTCNNLAACHFQWKNFQSVVELSTKVLESDPPNLVKTLYRRGVAYMELKDFDLAEKDLIRAKKAEPGNRAVNEMLGQAQQRKKSQTAKLAQQMSKMFA